MVFRLHFEPDAAERIDPFELAWLLSKHELEVVAKNERPMLFVKTNDGDGVLAFMDEISRQYGVNLFCAIEVETDHGYASLDATSA